MHPSGLTKFVEAVLDAADAGERLSGKGPAELEELDHREGAAIERFENLNVAIRQMAANVRICHGQSTTLAWPFG